MTDLSTAPRTEDYTGIAPTHWGQSGRRLVEKSIAELTFEGALTVSGTASDGWVLRAGEVSYTFQARPGALGNLNIAADSVIRHHAGVGVPADDPGQLLIDVQSELSMSDSTLCEALREMLSTRAAESRILAAMPTSAALADLSFRDLEQHLTGHPTLILNKGRIGFSVADSARYAPEAGAELRLPWIAVHRDLARFGGTATMTFDDLVAAELSDEDVASFGRRLTEQIADQHSADDYYWIPVHPWQWEEILTIHFAPLIADRRMVYLGIGSDRLRPTQSIRTLANVDRPDRLNVKVALSIRNTMVYRGIASATTVQATAINAWLQRIARRDEFLAGDSGLLLLGETASAAVEHPTYRGIDGAPYRLTELLGAVWREPIEGALRPDEHARSMAALLSVGSDGRPLIAAHVSRSGLEPTRWLQALFGALFPGLLHFLYQYGVAFAPHGQNVVVIYDDADVPVRIAIKDFAEDLNLLTTDLPEYADLPPAAEAVLHRWGPLELTQSIQTCIFSGQFRYLAHIAEQALGVPETRFWELVGEEILGYQARFPHLRARFEMFDLFVPSFGCTTLNVEQLDMLSDPDRSERDPGFDLIAGQVPNPLHPAKSPEPGS